MNKVIFLIFLVITDQLSKYFVVKKLSIGESFNIFSFLDLYLILNTGIAFSFLDDGGVYGRWILVTLVLLVCVYLTYILFTEKLRKYESVALLMILSGGIGNLIDRTLSGHVIDFIHFYYLNYSFYIFNFADTFITIGVMIYILDLLMVKLNSDGNKAS
tara:strand:+ start:17 stop:493 length:477 start_codon:yes stop_codon:yes gene_type:complete